MARHGRLSGGAQVQLVLANGDRRLHGIKMLDVLVYMALPAERRL